MLFSLATTSHYFQSSRGDFFDFLLSISPSLAFSAELKSKFHKNTAQFLASSFVILSPIQAGTSLQRKMNKNCFASRHHYLFPCLPHMTFLRSHPHLSTGKSTGTLTTIANPRLVIDGGSSIKKPAARSCGWSST